MWCVVQRDGEGLVCGGIQVDQMAKEIQGGRCSVKLDWFRVTLLRAVSTEFRVKGLSGTISH